MGGASSNRILIIAMSFIVLLVVFVLANSPKSIDWSLSFSKQDTKPFGCQLLYALLPELVDETKIQTSHGTFNSFCSDDSLTSANLIVINNHFAPEDEDIGRLLSMLDNGHQVFLSASSISDTIRSLFSIDYREQYGGGSFFLDSVSFNLANRKLRTHLGYWYKKGVSDNYFTSYDTLRTSVLGINNNGKTNFVKIKQGQGNLFLNLNPTAFTNYNLLVQDNYEYAFKCLSYLPNQATVWDEHYKYKYLTGQISDDGSRSILSFILDRTPLRIAWYVFLIGVFIFFVFESARRQRVVPIVKAPVNSTVSFIVTIGRLYFSRKNHLDIAQKRFRYLQEFIRAKYYINTSEANEDFYQQLSDKTSIPIRTVKQLFELGNNLSLMKRISEEDLEQFNRRIEYFYEQCK